MNSLRRQEISMIRKMLVENTDECFCVKTEIDDAGLHYVLYLVKGSVTSSLINFKMSELQLTKRHMIIFLEEDYVHIKREENER